MTEQWKELKETITEMRDNDGTGTQQEVCKFLVNLMDVLEKQMSDSEKGEAMEFPDTFDEFADSYGFVDTEEVYTNGSQLIPIFRVKQWLEHINPQSKMGRWIITIADIVKGSDICECSECGGKIWKYKDAEDTWNYRPTCGSRMEGSKT